MLIRNAELADGRVRDVRIDGDRIAAVDEALASDGTEPIDAAGKLLLPGMIDVHTHLRQPGFPHKETWKTGSRSAAAGGVTTIVDQPNTDPTTTTGVAFDEKASLARRSCVDYGLNGGVTAEWDPHSLLDRPLFALGEVFLADSTGDMGIDTALFTDALRTAREHSIPVTVHAEDADLFSMEARERDDADAWSAYRTPAAEEAAVEHACETAREVGHDIHIAHASTPAGIDAVADAGMTCEVTPHHLLLSRDDYDALGSYARMNPPLRSEPRREAVYERVVDGTVDMIATDHAPHTRAEKETGIWDAPSGVPGVETALPLLLEEARQDRLSYERVRDLTAANPAEVFGLPRKGRIEEGRDADLVLVDPEAAREIRGSNLHTKCEWTPFEGRRGVFPELTTVRGTVVYRDVRAGHDAADELRDRDTEFAEVTGKNVRE